MTLPITRCTRKPITVRMCGPYDGTPASAAEIRDFVGVGPDGAPGFHALDDGTGTARVWDALHDTWVTVLPGQWVVEGVQGENYPIAPDVLDATYEVIEPAE